MPKPKHIMEKCMTIIMCADMHNRDLAKAKDR